MSCKLSCIMQVLSMPAFDITICFSSNRWLFSSKITTYDNAVHMILSRDLSCELFNLKTETAGAIYGIFELSPSM